MRSIRCLKENCLVLVFSVIISTILYISFGWYSIWNPDSMVRIFLTADNAWVSQARWGAQLWEQVLRNQYVIPVFSLFLGIIFLSIIPIVIVNTFKIKNPGLQFLIVLSVTASLHQASTMSYAYLRDEFTFAYLLAVISAAMFLKAIEKNKVKYDIIGILALVYSLAIYQSYLSCSLALLCVGFILYCITEVDSKQCLKSVLRIGIDLVISIIIYVITVKLSLIFWKTEMSSYRNMDQSWININALPSMIRDAYISFYNYYFADVMFNNQFRGKYIIHGVLIVMFIVMTAYLVIRSKTKCAVKYVLICVDIALIPLLFNIVFLMTTTGVSFMMLPGVQYLYVSCAILTSIIIGEKSDNVDITKRIGVIIPCLTVIALMLVLYTNILQIFLLVDSVKVETNKTKAIAMNLDYSIKANDDYSEDKRLLILGEYKTGNYKDVWGWDESYKNLLKGTVLEFGQFWKSSSGTMNGWQHVFMYWCGTRYRICSNNEEAKNIKESQEYIDMPIYPKQGSMRLFDDIFVIKMSN